MSAPGAIVIGTGFGVRVHVPALRAAGFTVEALVGRDADRTTRRAERLGVARGVTDLDAALALPGVVAVAIATPPHPRRPRDRGGACWEACDLREAVCDGHRRGRGHA